MMYSLKNTVAGIALMLFAVNTFAQQATVAGKGYKESDFGKFYVRLGVSIPQGAFGKAFDLSVPLYENISKNGGVGADLGVNAEIGKYFFFHEDPINDLFKVGLDAAFFSFGYNMGKSKPHPDEEAEAFDFVTGAVKLGPVVSFNVSGDFYADVFFKLAPTALLSFEPPYHFKGGIYEPDAEVLYFNTDEKVNFAFKTDFGINLRYRRVTLTASYESGTFNVPMTYYQNDGAEEVYDTEPREMDGKMPMGLFQLKLGIQAF
ncbi:hypothetical protein [Parapedobacter indicus]|uniref:Outer membrane protein beta-barrel domain-containing protein n=1 Tax=Parapedobacter indicus TaxID=1477437 RepID=A0A1I3DI52_9SPHI|nr:hypothetical protein [Parapedobacter indicus]PPL04688.1 hypothetical protein CLV26_101491 [Parapedobacter indicus]SFH86405.1 hypothetical protein SAMN05444682_101478 [Parapedobacter indicus]